MAGGPGEVTHGLKHPLFLATSIIYEQPPIGHAQHRGQAKDFIHQTVGHAAGRSEQFQVRPPGNRKPYFLRVGLEGDCRQIFTWSGTNGTRQLVEVMLANVSLCRNYTFSAYYHRSHSAGRGACSAL